MSIWSLKTIFVFHFVRFIVLMHRVAGDANVQALDTLTTISCNDTQKVINITNVTLTRLPDQCRDASEYETISADAIKVIKTLCDNKKLCNVHQMISDREHFLYDFVYYNMSYSCELEVIYKNATLKECNFDDSWCDFSKEGNKSFKWRRRPGSSNNEPSADHTHPHSNEEGLFAYIYQKNSSSSHATASMSIAIETNSKSVKCLTFWIFKTDTNHQLRVFDADDRIDTLTKTFNTWEKIFVLLSSKYQHNITFKVSRQNKTFDGKICLDDVQIIDKSCEEIRNVTHEQELCVPLSSDYVVMNCTYPYLKHIAFGPMKSRCTTVHGQLNKQCDRTFGVGSCMLNLSEVRQKNPECFWRNDVQIHFTCLNDTKSLRQLDNSLTAETIGAVVGAAFAVICMLVALVLFIIRRLRKISKNTPVITEQTDDYSGQQNTALSNVQNKGSAGKDGHNRSNTHVEKSNYNYIESGHGLNQCKRKDNVFTCVSYQHNSMNHQNEPAIKSIADQSDGKYFALEKCSDEYSMAKPVVENESTYVISDTEYAVSGRNYHGGSETNVYDYSVDNFYDSSVHTRKANCDEDQYDHFKVQKTQDDYEISRGFNS